MATHTRRASSSVDHLPLGWKLAIGLLAILVCWAAAQFVAHTIQHFNSSMGLTQL